MSRSWQETIADQIAAQGKRAGRRSVAVNYSTTLYALVRDAARARGMSMTAYQRRAALAFALHDLGREDQWHLVMADEPAVAAFEAHSEKPIECAGFGPFGAWRIRAIGMFWRGER